MGHIFGGHPVYGHVLNTGNPCCIDTYHGGMFDKRHINH